MKDTSKMQKKRRQEPNYRAIYNRQNNNIARQRKAMNKATEEKRLERDNLLLSISEDKRAERDRLQSIADEERAKALTSNESELVEHKQFEAKFSNLFGTVSGYAIFGVLLLTIILEILLHRNGIEYRPAFESVDFDRSHLIEILYFPIEWIGRHVINRIRIWKENLPDLKKPSTQQDLSGYEGNIINLSKQMESDHEIAAEEKNHYWLQASKERNRS